MALFSACKKEAAPAPLPDIPAVLFGGTLWAFDEAGNALPFADEPSVSTCRVLVYQTANEGAWKAGDVEERTGVFLNAELSSDFVHLAVGDASFWVQKGQVAFPAVEAVTVMDSVALRPDGESVKVAAEELVALRTAFPKSERPAPGAPANATAAPGAPANATAAPGAPAPASSTAPASATAPAAGDEVVIFTPNEPRGLTLSSADFVSADPADITAVSIMSVARLQKTNDEKKDLFTQALALAKSDALKDRIQTELKKLESLGKPTSSFLRLSIPKMQNSSHYGVNMGEIMKGITDKGVTRDPFAE